MSSLGAQQNAPHKEVPYFYQSSTKGTPVINMLLKNGQQPNPMPHVSDSKQPFGARNNPPAHNSNNHSFQAYYNKIVLS